ncbi:hypothetical protein SK128_026675 [Halocaridina rubra]|uniref:Vascular endothelial growth factor receptor 1 n=1 Tax=Halocaridina rubra TaxID=373956 RepID=A0AAN9A0Z0_HALRR
MVAPSWKDDNLQQLNHDKKEMENLTLSCHATGAPSPQVSWYKDDVLLPETTSEADNKHRVVKGPEIHFKYLKLTDAGKYKCESINRAGMLSRTTTVAVTDPDANNFKSILIFIIIGSVLTIILIVLSVFYGRKLYLEKKRIIFCKLEEQKRFMEGNPEGLNPELGLELQAELLPYDIKYEFPRDSIIFDKLLGAGAFGRVYSATALNLIEGQLRTKVAVKMMKSRTDNAQRKALISEVKIMIHIGRHINIVNLLGACSKELSAKGELLLIVEYCKYGNILDYMRRHRKEFINQINDEDKIDPYLTGSRMRHRTESESRTRSFRGLKYAHLAFNQESVAYFPDRQLSDGTNSNHAWSEPQSPSATECQNGQFFDSQRTRNFSGISSINNENILSDMTTYTTESSNGGSEICNGSRSLGSNPITLTSTNILSWAYQIAKGMEYLAFKKVLHGDLAARNILLTDDNVVKISDFGLAKDIYKNANYTKKSKTPVPWKWLAPECIRDAVFSTQSDVWSYGVVLWEIFSLGNVPWPGIDFDNSFVVKLEKGVRLDQPRYATFDLYQVMMKCWDGDPINRPTFTDLENAISEMLSEAEKQRQLELNTPYQNENNASTFLNQLQSPDYNAKVRELSPNLDEDGYEMPFSPNACGAMAMPVPQISSPRLTPLQMQYQTNNTDESKSVYIPMSSPTKTSLNVFNFDKETVDAIEKRDSEIQDYEENKSMAGTPQETNYLFMHKNSPAPLTPVTPVTPVSSGNNVFSNTDIPLRPKGIRGLTLMNKHDSGLYSPTAYMQNNPQYVIPGPLGKTDENNYLTKDGCQDIFHDNKPNYINADCKSLPRNYTRQTSDGEYANLVPNGHGRGRTLSETSSGLGSISEESSPDMREKFEYMKSSVMEPAILEEPSQHSVQCQ